MSNDEEMEVLIDETDWLETKKKLAELAKSKQKKNDDQKDSP